VRRLGLAALLIAVGHDPYGRSAVAVAYLTSGLEEIPGWRFQCRKVWINGARPVLALCCLVNKKVVTEGSSIARMPERHGGWSEFS